DDHGRNMVVSRPGGRNPVTTDGLTVDTSRSAIDELPVLDVLELLLVLDPGAGLEAVLGVSRLLLTGSGLEVAILLVRDLLNRRVFDRVDHTLTGRLGERDGVRC